jgi:hypothetical protein
MSNPTYLLNFKNEYFEVIEYSGKDEKYKSHSWKCKCKCGNIIILRTNVVKSGATKSCGCGKKNPFVKGHSFGKRFEKTHGLSKHPLFRVWGRIIERCYRLYPSNRSYRYYRGKGIQVCDEWKNSFTSFYEWAIVNGWQKGLSIDRLNSNGNYEPSNCQFVTLSENSRRAVLENPSRGSFNGNSTFTNEQVIEIKNRLLSKESGASIARDYKVHRKTIYDIRDKKTWKHLGD